MRKIPLIPIIAGAVIVAVCFGVAVVISCSKKTGSQVDNGHSIIYHCPMHPNYLSHQPGNCPICGMTLVPAGSGSEPSKEKSKGRILYYRDAMNPSHTSGKPGKAPDGMAMVPVYESDDNGNGVKIDPAMMQTLGVQTEKAKLRILTRDVRTTATIMPDERRVTVITTKVMGYVEKLFVNYTGQRVKMGQPLFDLYSPDLVSAQTEYLLTYRKSVGDTSETLRSARRRLLNWDITEAQIAELEKRGHNGRFSRQRHRHRENGCRRAKYRTRDASLQVNRLFARMG
jgi:hypothetical protein